MARPAMATPPIRRQQSNEIKNPAGAGRQARGTKMNSTRCGPQLPTPPRPAPRDEPRSECRETVGSVAKREYKTVTAETSRSPAGRRYARSPRGARSFHKGEPARRAGTKSRAPAAARSGVGVRSTMPRARLRALARDQGLHTCKRTVVRAACDAVDSSAIFICSGYVRPPAVLPILPVDDDVGDRMEAPKGRTWISRRLAKHTSAPSASAYNGGSSVDSRSSPPGDVCRGRPVETANRRLRMRRASEPANTPMRGRHRICEEQSPSSRA